MRPQPSLLHCLLLAVVFLLACLEAGPASAQEPSVTSTSWDAVEILGRSVAAGGKRRLFLRASESFAGTSVEIPVLVIRGLTPGPTVCLTAGVHGDELNGIEIVRKVFEAIAPPDLSGMLIGVPVANLHGFRRSSRYLPDRRDLNRFFPGHPGGSSASRIASALFQNVVLHCDRLIDFHTGSFHRTNIPQLRADLRRPAVLEMARIFGTRLILHSEGAPGTLRRAAMDANITAITYEAGEPMRFQADEIERGFEGTRQLLAKLDMIARSSRGDEPEVFYRSRWVRVNDGGIFITDRELGESVDAGTILGTVTDPVSNDRSQVIAPVPGRIIGMALSQVVIPGFAAFHIGLPGDALSQQPDTPSQPEFGPDQLDSLEHPE